MRLIHGQESVTAGTPAQLTSEPLRAVKLWVKHGNGADGVARLSGATDSEAGVEIGAGPRGVRLHDGGQGQHRRLHAVRGRIGRHPDRYVDADGGLR